MGHVVMYGTDRFLILEKANQCFEEYAKQYQEVEKCVFQTSDAGFSFQLVKEAIETVSLFRMPKWVFLFVEQEKDCAKIVEEDLQQWLKLSTQDLVFVLAYPKKPPTKSAFRKCIIEYAQELTITVSGKDADSLADRVNRELRKQAISIDGKAKQLLMDRLGTNRGRIQSELEKLSLLQRRVTYEDVQELISFDLEQDIFALSNALLLKDHDEVFRIYQQLLKQKQDPLSLAPLIAASLRGIYQVSTLQSLNFQANDIRELLKMSEGQYWNITKKRYQSKDSILEILNRLATFDQESKKGMKDRFVSFEMLLLSIMM